MVGTARRAAVPALLVLLLVVASEASAQQLAVRTAPPPAEVLVCDAGNGDPESPAQGPGDTEGATRLVGAATQAMLLGDLDSALDFLDRALLLDPLAAEALYLQGRILQRQGKPEEAAAALCQFLRTDPTSPTAPEVRQRLEDALAEGVGRPLLAVYQQALDFELEGRLEEAEAAFTELLTARPYAAVALYNRAVVRMALGQDDAARADFERYVALEPLAADAVEVRRFLGAGAPTAGPQRGVAFLTGALVPGGGQYYTGRPLLGAAVTALAGGALAAGVLSERTTINCLDVQATVCPEERIASRETERPLLIPAIGAAAGVALIAAIEATLHAGRASRSYHDDGVGAVGPARLLPVGGIHYEGASVRLELVRLNF